ncbi:MAG: transglycosylase domain-containing protein [Bacteroidales bacterium]|nr:transglycosylase domain-containing protein [Bacteroidales bacterium]
MINFFSKKLIYRVYLPVAVFIFVLFLSFLFRNFFLNLYVNKKINQFKAKYNAELNIGKVKFRGINTIVLNNIFLKPLNKDTLINVESAAAKINIWKMLLGKLTFSDIELDKSYVKIVADSISDNYSFLVNKTNVKKEISTADNYNYSEKTEDFLNAIFGFVPDKIKIHDFTVNTVINKKSLGFYIDNLNISDNTFKTIIKIKDAGENYEWLVEGKLNNRKKQCFFKLYSSSFLHKVKFPFVENKYDMKVSFDTIQFNFSNNGISNKVLNLDGTLSANGLIIKHPRISSDNVYLTKVSINYFLNIGSDYYEVDSATSVVFNKINFNPYIKYKPKPSKQITLILNKKDFNAQDFFDSLPAELFSKLDGIKVKGTLSYHLNFFVDTALPDSVKLQSELKRKDFKIIQFGKVDFRYVNEPFTYTAYNKDEPVRIFEVSPANPNFRTLEQIPELLREVVMTNEDGGFIWHKGFAIESIKKSIAANIKEGRFARGGSTISMQLVKNLFLTRKKTISRKLEEMLIVWLIENNNLISKNRMLEIYFNIIEWGPMVYGANEAAHYYFNKDVSKLTLSEDIYLASIIPRPRLFKYSFDKDKHLLEWLAEYYRIIAQILLRKEKISQEEADNLVPDVQLKGPAKFELMQPDSIPLDSVFKSDFEFMQLNK